MFRLISGNSFIHRGIRKMNTIRRVISMITVLLILVSTAGHGAYAAESESGTSPDEVVDAVSSDEEEDTETAAQETDTETAAQETDTETAAQESDTEVIKPVTQQAGSYIVEAESADYFRYENGHLYIYGGTVSVKTRPDVEYSTDRIEVSGYAVLVLSGVRIKAENGAAIRVLPGADAEIRLDGSEENNDKNDEESLSQRELNYVEGAAGYAGIEAGTLPRGDGSRGLLSSLRITGEGSLTSVGGQGAAAIGGSRGQNACGIIVIEEGNIKAVAGADADGIGCGELSSENPVYAPAISDHVRSLLVLSDGKGRPVAAASDQKEDSGRSGNSEDEEESERSGNSEDEEESEKTGNSEDDDASSSDTHLKGFSPASMLTATFAEPGDGSLAGLENVRVRETNGDFETAFDMPEGYRSFAVKVKADSDYMIEQGGRTFADAGEEEFSGMVEESGEADILFRGTTDPEAERIFLAPALEVPAIDVEVTGYWEDEDNRDGTRPGSVLVTLYANGSETGRTITLSEENDFSGTFDDLPVYSDCVRQCYSIVEDRLEGYTGLISGSDREGYSITNQHEPLPEGRSSADEIALRNQPVQKGVVVAKVLTTKVSRSTPVRTSTTIKKSRSAKTADSSGSTRVWGAMLLAAAAALYIWMKIEQKRGN